MSLGRRSLLSLFILAQLFFSTYAFAQSEEERSFLSMYFKEDELRIISATRSLKSITRVAENVEVVTASDIRLMNAHSLADVLSTINGIQIAPGGSGPGSDALAIIQGSTPGHVTFFWDGIPMNNLNSSNVNAGFFPVQMIDRIEVIKGPASSVWGSSLGGIVNIITKGPPLSEGAHGTLSASYGERNTGDYRAEVYGAKNDFGYYLSAGRLQTDGFQPFFFSSRNDFYTKLSYDVSRKSNILFTFLYNKPVGGEGDDKVNDLSFNDRSEYLFSTLAYNAALSKEVALTASLWLSRQTFKLFMNQESDNALLDETVFKERSYGGSTKVTWQTGVHSVVSGIDVEQGTLESATIVGGEQDLWKWAVYANDTIALGNLTLVPGIRFDHANLFGDFTSPSFGITYNLAGKTLLRAYVARGFSDPALSDLFNGAPWFTANPSLKPEKVWSYQAGIETGELRYLWLKVSAFRHDIKDGIVEQDLPDGTFTRVNLNSIRRQGVEAELKTLPFYNTVLQAAAIWMNEKNLTTGEEIKDVPEYTYFVALKYDDEKSFKALFKGYYIWWNEPDTRNAKYSSMIFDLNMIKTFYRQKDRSLAAFLTAHNLFNGSQYYHEIFPNAKRWFEGGLRFTF